MTTSPPIDDLGALALRPLQKAGLVIGPLAFLVPFFIDIPGLEEDGERMLAIFLLAVVFWITEAIPLFATAAVVILLQVFLVSSTALVPTAEGAPSAASIFASLSNPVIILFMGGFLIATGAAKFHLDRNIAAVFMKPFASSVRTLILGMMLVTAVLSMFMSNTATTAAMFALITPILKRLPTRTTQCAMALSIPVAANIGGIGTPVGTPPNAIAIAALSNQGVSVSFLQWMALALPLWVPLLAFAWFVLTRMVPKGLGVELEGTSAFDRSWRAWIFYLVTALTIVLWMTEPLHGISSNTVGFVPVALLFAFRVLSGSDLRILDWPVLWLVAGGIALGDGMSNTGLDNWMLSLVNWETLPGLAVLVLLVAMTWGMSALISNSATANLVVPLSISFAALAGENVVTLAAVVALAASLAMPMPISTPPNAIAYATGYVSLKTMALVGVVIGLVGTSLVAFVLPPLWHALGVA